MTSMLIALLVSVASVSAAWGFPNPAGWVAYLTPDGQPTLSGDIRFTCVGEAWAENMPPPQIFEIYAFVWSVKDPIVDDYADDEGSVGPTSTPWTFNLAE